MANKSERIQNRSESVASETNNLLRSTEDLASELLRVNSNIEAQTARRDALIKVITDREGWGALVKTIGGQCIQVGALDSRVDMDALKQLGLYDAVYDAGIEKARADYDKACDCRLFFDCLFQFLCQSVVKHHISRADS